MGISEGNAVIYQIIGSICRICKASLCAGFHYIFSEGHRGDHPCKQGKTAFYRINSIKGKLLILLHIFIISQRNSLHSCQHGHQGSIDTAALSADQLGNIGVLLLGHNAASGAVGIVDLHKPVLICIPDNNFLTETA